ncbi:MAG: hypothetical protein WDN72_07305 [Alphaproteobacteria bacterium]
MTLLVPLTPARDGIAGDVSLKAGLAGLQGHLHPPNRRRSAPTCRKRMRAPPASSRRRKSPLPQSLATGLKATYSAQPDRILLQIGSETGGGADDVAAAPVLPGRGWRRRRRRAASPVAARRRAGALP